MPYDKSDSLTAQWSVVMEAMHADPERARAALEKLCSRYRHPVYAFVRRKGYVVHDA